MVLCCKDVAACSGLHRIPTCLGLRFHGSGFRAKVCERVCQIEYVSDKSETRPSTRNKATKFKNSQREWNANRSQSGVPFYEEAGGEVNEAVLFADTVHHAAHVAQIAPVGVRQGLLRVKGLGLRDEGLGFRV